MKIQEKIMHESPCKRYAIFECVYELSPEISQKIQYEIRTINELREQIDPPYAKNTLDGAKDRLEQFLSSKE